MSAIRLATHRDLPALQRFFHEHWQADHVLSRDPDLLCWQYGLPLDGQQPNTLSMLLLEVEGAIHGILGFLPVTMSLGNGSRARGAWLAHWMVVESARASGAGLQLMHKLRSLGIDVISVLGINDTVKELYRRLGFVIIDNLPRYLAIVDPEEAYRLASSLGMDLSAEALSELASPCTAAPDTGVEVRSRGGFDDSLETWLNQWAEAHPGTWRDTAYLRWRYQRHPRFIYRHLTALQDGQVRGVCTYRLESIRNRPESTVRITDLLAEGAPAEALIQAVLMIAREQSACFVDYYSSLPLDPKCLAAGFFLPEPGSPMSQWPSRLQPLDRGYTWMSGAVWAKAGSHLLNTPEMYLSKSDGDADRPN